MTLVLNNKIKCKLYAKNPPVKLLNLVSVDRSDGAEVGPTEYLGKVKPHANFVIKPTHDSQTVTIHSTRKKFQHKRGKTSPHVMYSPYIGKPQWIFKNNPQAQDDDANVFGASGIVRFPRLSALQIPYVNALDMTAKLYKDFGVQLIPFNAPLPPMSHTTYFVTYELNDTFIKKYVHHKKGPGIFIEHHKFTHYLTPATPMTHGPIVVGRLMRDGRTKLIGVDVPYGYTLVIPGGCLHNDWYVVGKVATTIALDDQAKTAFVHGKDSKKIAMEFLRTFKK